MKLIRLAIGAALLSTLAWAHAADALGEANKKIVLAFYDAALVKYEIGRAHV